MKPGTKRNGKDRQMYRLETSVAGLQGNKLQGQVQADSSQLEARRLCTT